MCLRPSHYSCSSVCCSCHLCGFEYKAKQEQILLLVCGDGVNNICNMHASLPFINICLTHPPLNSWFSFLFAMRCTETQSNTSLHNLYPPFCSQFKPEEKTGSSFSVHICKPFAIFGCLLIAFSASNSRPPSFSILSQRCHQSSHCFHFSYDFQTNSLNQIAEFCVHACPVFTLMPFAAWLLF